MNAAVLVAAAVRWAGFLALACLVGSLAVEALVLPRDAPESALAARRLRRLAIACLAVLVVTTAGELLARAGTMADGDLAAALGALPAVLTRTHFGAVWIARFVLLGAACAVIGSASRPARLGALGLGLALAMTTSLTGHAADGGDLTWAVAADWVHVVAVSAWTGGLLALAALGEARRWPAAPLGVLMGRFSRLAGACVAVALVTGGYSAWVALPHLSALWTSDYGRVLAAKLLLVGAAIALGAINRYAILSRLGRRRTSSVGERCARVVRIITRGPARIARSEVVPRLSAGLRREGAVVVLVFAATAILVGSTPARHAEHAERHRAEARGPFRVTMNELHESGGVPRGWALSLPAGDAARGRDVFVRLGCPACHKAGGGAPPGVGPDLTGAGDHHPAGYLLESIVNPSAVIVEAPGYTTPDGRSIMPDYRGQLSVGELIDLVAYVQSL